MVESQKKRTRRKATSEPGKSTRSYSQKTLGLLWGLAGNQCAYPSCEHELIADATDFDPAAILGHIAHIYSSSDKGPRANPGLTAAQRDDARNLLLLCRHHHGLVDAQDSTYTAEQLVGWKKDHEAVAWAKKRTEAAAQMNRVSFPELEAVASGLLALRGAPGGTLVTVPPADKMRLNDLGMEAEFSLTIGASKSQEVGRFIALQSQLDDDFGRRLRSGFVHEYQRLRAAGCWGDDLFDGMLSFAHGRREPSEGRRYAGLAILSHLFILCDVFETSLP
ncbi:HNH endonuclease [Sphingomonas sp. NIC1]|uniref:HNH endonuclease n=1 Tax=Sphingomonas sp. NIC1 TaxID=1961362 RepID=UPI00125DD829|nr:HNH endonuclease [Sphingomonas sp. NIC1]